MAPSISAAELAISAGADRLELCENTAEGGTTPSAGTISIACARAAQQGIPVFVMVRPRGGDFVFSNAEFEVMLHDLDLAIQLGASGIVTGILRPDGSVDVDRTRTLVGQAQGLPVTFHRAVDLSPDLVTALKSATEAGCARVLTSGGATSAEQGVAALRSLVDLNLAGIVAAGSINETNVARIVALTGVQEVHAAVRTASDEGRISQEAVPLGSAVTWGPDTWPIPDVVKLSKMRRNLR